MSSNNNLCWLVTVSELLTEEWGDTHSAPREESEDLSPAWARATEAQQFQPGLCAPVLGPGYSRPRYLKV